MKVKLIQVFLFLTLISHSLSAQDEPSFFEYEVVYSALPWYNANGGLEPGFVYMDNADVTAKFNFDQLFTWNQSLSLFLYGLGNHGGKATDLMGDFQVASNIQAPRSWRFFEVWVQQNFLDDQVSVLVGLYDLNSEFDVLLPATVFINSSFGIGAEYAQTGENGPSIFPISSFGMRISSNINKYVKLKLAVFDGVSGAPSNPKRNPVRFEKGDGALIAFEAAYYPASTSAINLKRGYVTRRKKVGREHGIPTDDKINLGGWYYTAKFPELDGGEMSRGNWGMYLGAQKYLFYSKYDDRYLALFARYGIAADQYNQLGSAISGGLLFAGSASGKTDYIGLGITRAINGEVYMDENNLLDPTETAIELTYSTPLRKWLTLQPDLQYIVNPGFNPETENALAGGLLVQVTF